MINFFSLLIGLLVAYLLNGHTRVIDHGGDSNIIKNQIDQRADGCYRYHVEPVICPI